MSKVQYDESDVIVQCDEYKLVEILVDQNIKTNSDDNSIIIYTTDGCCIKVFDEPIEINVNRIITAKDCDLKSFAFPIKLYADMNHRDSDGEKVNLLYAFKYSCIENDILVNNSSVDSLSFKDLYDAYVVFMEEIKKLSKVINKKIMLCDLDGNLVYDGNRIVAINTINYGIKKGYSKAFENKGRIIKGQSLYSFAKEWDYDRLNRKLVDDALKNELAVFSGNEGFKDCETFKHVRQFVVREYGDEMIIPRKKVNTLEKPKSNVKKLGAL